MSKIILAEQASAPDTPGTDKVAIFVDANGDLAWKDDAGNVTKIAAAGSYTLTIPATGTAALLGTAQTFSAVKTFDNALVAPGMKPAADSTTALQLQNAAGTAVLTVDTTNSTVNALRFKVNVISLANDAVQTVAGTFGMCLVQNNSAGGQLLLFLSGSSTNTISSIGTSLSTTKDTADKVNVYIEGGALKIQNKSGGTLTLSYLTFTS